MTAAVAVPARRARVERGRAGERPLPVLPALEPLLPGGLRRGSAVAVRGSASLLLALLAGPSREGAWCAVVGLPALGLVAAEEAGVALERLALVPDPGPDWAAVTGALLDAVDVVAVAPRGRVLDGDVRRLAARARQRGAVLVPYGAVRWPGAELRLSVAAGTWEGLGEGSGRLQARRVVVRGEGRGSAARGRELRLWLPAPGGGVRADTTPLLRAVPDLPPAPLSPAPPPAPARPGGRARPDGPPGLVAARVEPAPAALARTARPDGPAHPVTPGRHTGLAGPVGPVGPAGRAGPAAARVEPTAARTAGPARPGAAGSAGAGQGAGRGGVGSGRLRAVPDPGPRGPGTGPGPGLSSAGPGPARPGGAPPPRPARPGGGPPPRPRPVGHPVPIGRYTTVGGGGVPVPPPPVAARPGARPRIPAEALARLRPASTLPRPARRAPPG